MIMGPRDHLNEEGYRIFQEGLKITPPWFVKEVRLNEDRRRLDIILDFPKGSRFKCPECGCECTAYDTRIREWRHLDFFQYATHIFAPLPRIECPTCGVRTVEVPWASRRSGFTILFEALAVELSMSMNVSKAAKKLRISDDTLWRMLRRSAARALEKQDLSDVFAVAVDETSWRKGHKYVTFVFDYWEKRLIFATEGRGSDTLALFADHLKRHGGDPMRIREVCCDMSPAYIKGVEENLPRASVTFDKFHVVKAMNDALDKVRRRESAHCAELKGTRWYWRKNEKDLSAGQRESLERACLSGACKQTGKAYRMKILLQRILDASVGLHPEDARSQLKDWCHWALVCRIPEVAAVGMMIKRHFEGIVRWFHSRMTNAMVEGYNSVLRAGRSMARGFRTVGNVILKSFLMAGKLDFDFPRNIWNPV